MKNFSFFSKENDKGYYYLYYMSYHDSLIDLQKHNLFEIPLEKETTDLNGIKS